MKTYRRINAVRTTIEIINYLSDQREPVSGADTAGALNMQYPTVMCHLVTLEDAGIARRVGENWELGTGMALFWAKKKSRLKSERDTINNLLSALGE